MLEIKEHKPKVHLIVCVNTRLENQPHCGTIITRDAVKEVKKWIIENGLLGTVQCTASFCQGHCNPEGGVATIYPSGKRFKSIQDIQELKDIISAEMNLA